MSPLRPEKKVHIVSNRRVAWAASGSRLMPIRAWARGPRCLRRRGDMKVGEIWASREQMEAFGEGLMPFLVDIGIEFSGEPEVFAAHNLVKS